MKYSNGFDVDVILPALRGRLGWLSDTGVVRNFEAFHPLATEQNLRDTQPNAEISDGDFDDYKTSIKDQVIQSCLSSVFIKPENIEQVLLHNRIAGSVNQTITNTDRFCGLRLSVAPDIGISQWVKTVTLLFDSAVTFNLYLFQDGTPAPIKTISVTTEANTPKVIEVEDALLSYYNSQCTTFYLGYFQSDIGSAKAIREQVCYNQTRTFAAISFESPKTGSERFDQSQVSYNHDAYGINAEVHAFRDFTGRIKRSAYLFDELIGLQMAYAVCKQIIYSTQSNRNERLMKDHMDKMGLQYELDGSIPVSDVPKTGGLQAKINKEVKRLQDAFYPSFKSQVINALH